MLNVPEKKHALLSPSSAKMWTTCHQSVVLGKDMPDLPQTEYARQGSVAHAYAEERLLAALAAGGGGKVSKIDDEEMEEHVNNYVEFCLAVKRNFSRTHKILDVAVEKTVKNTANNWGTADFILFGERLTSGVNFKRTNSLVIVDFKYGKGIDVSVEDNLQLANYAVAAQATYKCTLDTVYMYIYQPRVAGEPYARWVLDKPTLDKYRKEFKRHEREILQEIIGEKEAEFVPGDLKHCRFCKVCPVCPAFKQSMVKDALVVLDGKDTTKEVGPKVDTLTFEQVTEIFKRKKAIEHFLDEVENYILCRMQQGEKSKDFKIVAGRRQRRWIKDKEDEIAATLIERGVKEPWRKKLLTLADAEKELGGKDAAEKISDLVNLTPLKLQIAPVDDKRSGIDVASELRELLDGE